MAVTCTVRVPLAGSGFAGGATASVDDQTGDAMEVTLPIAFADDNVAEGASAGLKCIRTDGTGPDPKFIYASITAVKVGSVAGSGIG